MKTFYLFALLSLPVSATYTTMTIEGVQQANGVWTAAGVVDNMGFVRTTGAVSVLGQTTKNLPVAMALDIPASSRMLSLGAKAMGPVALAATAYDVYEWVTSDDISSSGNEWVLDSETSTDIGYSLGSEWYSTSFQGSYSSPEAGCRAYAKHLVTQGAYLASDKYTLTQDPSNPDAYSCEARSANYQYIIGNTNFRRRTCTNGSELLSCTIPTNLGDDYFLKLPLPSLPTLANGLNGIPSLSGQPYPITGTTFTPFSMWQGDPYFKDGTWYRDRMDISPCPTSSQPNRVCVDIGPQKFDGETDPTKVPSQAVGTAGGGAPKEKPEFCKANPKSIACQEFELGELEPEPLESTPVQFKLDTNQSWGASNSQCPASPKITIHTGEVITFNYQPTCDFLSMIRPFIIAFAILTAVFIAIGRTD